MLNEFRRIFAQHEFHVVVEKNKIWLYFWKERSGSKFLDKLDFDCWAAAYRFIKEVNN